MARGGLEEDRCRAQRWLEARLHAPRRQLARGRGLIRQLLFNPARRRAACDGAQGTARTTRWVSRAAGGAQGCSGVEVVLAATSDLGFERRHPVVTLSDTTIRLVAGVMSAVVARTCVAPLERIKMEHQIKTATTGWRTARPLGQSMLIILRAEGILGFWKGNGVNILRTAPYKAMNFYMFDTLRDSFLARKSLQQQQRNPSAGAGDASDAELTNSERAMAGAGAGITAALMFFPLDVVRTRLLATDKYKQLGISGTMRSIVAAEGVGGLYRGILPALLSMAPNGAVFYGVYDCLKMAALRARHRQRGFSDGGTGDSTEPLEVWRMLLHGAVAGAASEASTYPLDLVRRRLQLSTGAFRATDAVQRMRQITATILARDGVRGMYLGLGPSVLQVLPSAALGYFSYETTKRLLEQHFVHRGPAAAPEVVPRQGRRAAVA